MLQNKINMNFNLVEMYNGLLRFNKHILNELAAGYFGSNWVRSVPDATVGFFTTVKLD